MNPPEGVEQLAKTGSLLSVSPATRTSTCHLRLAPTGFCNGTSKCWLVPGAPRLPTSPLREQSGVPGKGGLPLRQGDSSCRVTAIVKLN
ncbi:hypothetical protein SKAU_G00181890 [Synaphobranchus kaupii]|uniref:Uncharacterized protein n=1 Tax=Synaphobranchus kaupii TaxID=118154 RepID=A0A9Q1FBR8_SYNKA|nr:hypothetical protein SKAU_G00181890 [Synaphobranchus kaupii]